MRTVALFVILGLVACAHSSASTDGVDAGAAGDGSIGPDAADAADADAAPAPLPTARFRIGMWCGLPPAQLTKARVDEIAAAGFTTMSNACDGASYVAAYDQTMLALAQGAKLDAIVVDQRVLDALAGTNAAANLDAVVRDYASSPALAGYFVGDEPSASQFAAVASVVSGLASRDPAHFAYTNLLPDYASAQQLGTATYDDYVAQFLSTAKPKVVSWDYYPFLAGGADAPTFFADMAVVRARAIASATPFWQFVQSISYNGHRATTAAEKQWVGMQTIAYGGAGVSYFTYWTPPQTSENFGNAIIDLAGNQTAQYGEVKAINARLSAFGRYLVAAQSKSVFHNGQLAAGTAPRVPGAIAYLPNALPITVGTFALPGRSDAYVFLANRSYANAVETDVIVATAATPEALDVATATFAPMTVLARDATGAKVHVSIAAGDGALVHLPSTVSGPAGAEAFVGVVRADQGTLDVVDSSFGTASLRGAGWNDCPEGYTLAGRDFVSNGFWLCARSDLASKTFYVGNVVADAGTMFAVSGGQATSRGAAGWDTCPAGKLLGHRFESNGYWVCLE